MELTSSLPQILLSSSVQSDELIGLQMFTDVNTQRAASS